MRRQDDSVPLETSQSAAADAGVKAMIPFGRPFLDYVLGALADEEFTEACLVIGAEHNAIRDYYGHRHPHSRIQVHFAVQPEPRGTADAVVAAEQFLNRDEFAVINSDNYYPREALRMLRALGQPGTVLFEEEHLVRESNIPPDRLRAFAYGMVDEDGFLKELVEKPDEATLAKLEHPGLISMNIWRFSPEILEACKNVALSPRGEYELSLAVQDAINAGVRFKVQRCSAGVLDLSQRADIPAVIERLKGVKVSL